MRVLKRLAEEPPFRLITAEILKRMNCALETRMRWDLSPRPAYLLGVGRAALLAQEMSLPAMSVIECGVARGDGLVILEQEAIRVGREVGIEIHVYGMDRAKGLPQTSGDYRDHPDYWVPGDFPMDVPKLQARLRKAKLILGEAHETLPQFMPAAPLGFMALDVDLWSSSLPCLEWLARVPKLLQTAIYVDDIIEFRAHSQAGELLAITQFNEQHRGRFVIEPWRRITDDRPFPERGHLKGMFVCHDLDQISAKAIRREARAHAYGEGTV